MTRQVICAGARRRSFSDVCGREPLVVASARPDPVPVSIVTDAVGFCQLAANRAVPAGLELHITGDRRRAAAVLAAVPALALD